MSNNTTERPENKHDRADRIARELIDAERNKVQSKTERLRALRLEMEKWDN
ncbi:hypothetical protein ACI0FM_05970 [Paenochrobactrum sp. BZR 588]|uniref:hypothetical protein n=1 Tax=Paenochrobactrum TaxID=999488 RepID=UPI0035BC3D59